jgi:hypothetical protein
MMQARPTPALATMSVLVMARRMLRNPPTMEWCECRLAERGPDRRKARSLLTETTRSA